MKKPSIRSILVYSPPADRHALRDAKFLAKATGARLKIADAIEPVPLHVQVWLPQSSRMAEALRANVENRLHRKIAGLKAEGVRADFAILEGTPDAALLREVARGGYDLLMVGAARTPEGRLSTRALRLLRKCPCPVWIEGARAVRGESRVLAALDAIPGDEDRAELNGKIVALAATLAKACGAELHLVNAWEAYGESLLRSRLGAKPEDIARYAAEIQHHHAEEIRNVLRRARVHVAPEAVHLIKGPAAEVLPAACRKWKASILVLGTVARSGLSAALIGNTTESVASFLPCSMLAVKPDPDKTEEAPS